MMKHKQLNTVFYLVEAFVKKNMSGVWTCLMLIIIGVPH